MSQASLPDFDVAHVCSTSLGDEMLHILEEHLRENNEVTADDVYDRMTAIIPEGVSRRVIGSAFAELARKKLIVRTGVTNSRRKELHYQRISVWKRVG